MYTHTNTIYTQTNTHFLTGQEEGVVLVPGRVLLGLEQRVKVPEGALDEVVGGHLTEPAGDTDLVVRD